VNALARNLNQQFMKKFHYVISLSVCFIVSHELTAQTERSYIFDVKKVTVKNLFIITLDGFRWQELFNGAEASLINDEKFTPDKTTLKTIYWASTPEERRKKLMPFFWNVVGKEGQVYGNRFYDNNVNVANLYALSYPGYNEIFTGYADPSISSNKKKMNSNPNVLQFLHTKTNFHGKVAAFTSWEVFPYIFNEKEDGFFIDSGHDTLNSETPDEEEGFLNATEDEFMDGNSHTRYDELTFLVAKEYIKQHRPRVVYLGLGETDEFAHQGRYDLYLEKANLADKIIADLWHWVQTTPDYANNTAFIITTDHGRGRKNKWTSHNEFISGSSQTWMAFMGPGITPLGEIKEHKQIYQYQLAQWIARLLGEEFIISSKHSNPVTLF
jgi:hypothetical protein